MTEQELVERLRYDAIAWHDVDLGVRLAEGRAALEVGNG